MLHPRTIALTCALAVLAVGGALAGASAGASGVQGRASQDSSLHLNQIQVIGSHNSYHEVAPEPEAALRRKVIGSANDELMYNHLPLPTQFQSQRVRQIELDVFLDPVGGKYAKPLIRGAAGLGAYDPAMNEPGIKVLHVQDVDYHSTCLSLKDCLTEIRSWSDDNPSHMPIAILIELKDDPLSVGGFTFVTPDPWTAAALDTLDGEIRDVFPADHLITPDDVRAGAATLEDAVTTTGWPTLADSRGKVLFLMDNRGAYRTRYLSGHPNLEGRVLFTNSTPGNPDAAFVERNDSTAVAEIRALVAAGYVVRTRADADTLDARANDTTHRDDAFDSGAQWVSTDYPTPGLAVGFTSPYYAQIPGGTVARCNPVNAPKECDPSQIDTIYTPLAVPPTSTTTVPQPSVPAAPGADAVSGTSRYTG